MIDWEKYGFKDSEEFPELYERDDFPLMLSEEDGCLNVYSGEGPEYKLSAGQIPASNQAVVLLLKAFNVPKQP